jgi:hypothetical protein
MSPAQALTGLFVYPQIIIEERINGRPEIFSQ